MTSIGPDENSANDCGQKDVIFPPGLVGVVADFFYSNAPRQSKPIALAGAIAYLAGICGNAYNVSATGLNQYILILADTGVGKDAIADGVNTLNAHIHFDADGKPFPHGGPELVSSAGLIRWLEDYPCCLTFIGEAPKKLREFANPRNANAYALSRTLLQMYSKSGANSRFDPLSYSDRDKRSKALQSPSLSIFAEGTTDEFDALLTPAIVADGMMPRFMVWEIKSKRPLLNKGAAQTQPSHALVEALKDLVVTCATHRQARTALKVPLTSEAEVLFDAFDELTTAKINASNAEVSRQLWNRAHLKALKLAALTEVGINMHAPEIKADSANYAIGLISRQTQSLIAKFDSGQIGEVEGNQIRQINKIISVIGDYLKAPWSKAKSYGQSQKLHKLGIVTNSYVQQRVFSLPAFKPKPTQAVKEIIGVLIDSGDLYPINPIQMKEICGNHARGLKVEKYSTFGLPTFFED